jgi:hypothetical protein
MPVQPRAQRRASRIGIRSGTGAAPIPRRSSAKRIALPLPSQDALRSSDRLMLWGWAVAVSFVLAGLTWHLLTYQHPRHAVKTANAVPNVIECNLPEQK